jgi:hypothetical protein
MSELSEALKRTPSFGGRTCPTLLDLELSSLDRMHFRTMFPAAMQPTITDPVAGIIVSRVWADEMHTNSSTDPREIRQISDKRTLLLGQNPTVLVRTGQSPFRCTREMRSCTRQA